MPRQTPGGDFPPWLHPSRVMSPCSQGPLTDSSASLNIISNNLRLPSLEHQDKGGSLHPGGHRAGTDVCELSQLAPAAGGARHSWGAQSRPCQEPAGFHTDPGCCKGSCLLPASPLLVDNPLLWSSMSAAPSSDQPPDLPSVPAPLPPQLVVF